MQDKANYGSTGPTPSESETIPLNLAHYSKVILFTCFLGLLVLAEGYDFGVLNGALVRMKDDLKISTLQISMVVTVTPLSVMPGSLLGGALADNCGRRGGIRLTCIVLIVGPICMALSTSVNMLLASRAIVGCGIGMGVVIVSMYITELSPMHLRGRLTSFEDIFLNLGMVLGYFMNWCLLGIENDWRWMLGLGSVLPLCVLVVLCLPQMPESPRWLFMMGRHEEAERTLTQFVGEEEAKRDLQMMGIQQQNEDFVTWGEVLGSWHIPKTRRMLLAGLVVGIAQVGGGYLAISYYSSTVLKNSMSEEAAFMATTIMGVVKFVTCLVTIAVLESVGRRPMLLTGTSIMGIACAWLAFSFAHDVGAHAHAIGFILFMMGFSLGLGPIMFVYISEVFVTRWRSKAMGFVLFVSRILGALTTFAFPLLLEEIGLSTTFWLMCAANVLLVLLMWVFVLETHGRSLEKMEDLFEEPCKIDSKSP